MSEGKSKILVVDDDQTMLNALGDMVTECGYTPLCVSSWTDALRIFQSAKPDLVILDVMMPTIDGYKLAKMMKAQSDSFVPIILLTALGDIESKRRGMASGADDFLTKPVVALELKIRLSSMLRIKELTDRIQGMNAKLAELAVTDALTQLLNRRALTDHLEREFARAKRYEHPLSVFMLDVDHFKKVNDVHGHATGDDVLVFLASTLRSTLRETDVIARYGGEEFIVVAPETTVDASKILAERIRERVERCSDEEPVLPAVTVSIGIANSKLVEASTPNRLVELADAALYDAKRSGRNRWVLAQK